MATPTARLRDGSSSSAAASAPGWFRSAITTLAPSAAKVRAISLPIPLAAPVTTATLSLRRMDFLLAAGRLFNVPSEIIIHDLAKPQGQIAQDVHRGKNLQDRQLGDRCHGMGAERQCARTGPCALDGDVLEVIFDQLANAGAAIDVRDDFQQEVGCRKRRLDRRLICLLVL